MSAKRRSFVWRRAPDQRRPARLRSSQGVAHCWQDIGSELAVVLGIAPWGVEQFFGRYAALPEDAKNPTSFRALAPATGMTVVGATRGLYRPAGPAAPDQEGESK